MASFLTETEGTYQILQVAGRLDPSAGEALRAELDRLAAEPSTSAVLVDLTGVDYMASAGFRELFLAGRKLARNNSQLAVCGLSGEVKRVFELAKFDTAYPIYATKEDALEDLRQKEG